jgi:hypothetical protein
MIVKMFFIGSGHNPPHFHVLYGEYLGEFEIQTGRMLQGDLPAKAQRLVQEWLQVQREPLLEMWNTQTFRKLPPLL